MISRTLPVLILYMFTRLADLGANEYICDEPDLSVFKGLSLSIPPRCEEGPEDRRFVSVAVDPFKGKEFGCCYYKVRVFFSAQVPLPYNDLDRKHKAQVYASLEPVLDADGSRDWLGGGRLWHSNGILHGTPNCDLEYTYEHSFPPWSDILIKGPHRFRLEFRAQGGDESMRGGASMTITRVDLLATYDEEMKCISGCESKNARLLGDTFIFNTAANAASALESGEAVGGLALDVQARSPSASLATPGSLNLSGYSPSAEVIRSSDDSIRQILQPDGLVDVSTVSPTEYQIKKYHANAVGNKSSGVYTTTGDFYSTITVKNPSGSTNDVSRLLILNDDGGGVVTNDLRWVGANNGWTLDTGNGLSRTEIIQVVDSNGRQETIKVINPATGTVLSSETRSFLPDSQGGTVSSHSVKTTGTNVLLTSYGYYTNTTDNGFQKYQMVVYPTLDWKCFDYDTNGRPLSVCSAFLTNSYSSGYTRLESYAYDLLAGSGDIGGETNTPRTTIKYVTGYEVERSYLVVLAGAKKEIRCATPGASWTNTNNLVTTTRYYTNGFWSNLVQSIKHPDGTLTLYDYSTNSTSRTDTVWAGQANTNDAAVVDGRKTVKVTGVVGEMISHAVYDIASGILTDREIYSDYDEQRRPQRITYLDGTFKEIIHGCCGVESETDRDGVTITYTYDDLKRVATRSSGGITWSYTYDAAGRTLTESRQGTNGVSILLRGMAYDLAGRLTAETNALGEVTRYSEWASESGFVTKQTFFPDGSYRYEMHNRDGSLHSIYGTAVVKPVRYSYSYYNGESITQEMNLNPNGTITDEYTATYRDMAGRVRLVIKPASSGPAYYYSYYNNLGQLWKEVDPDGVITLHQYNARGDREYTVLDMDRDSVIDFAGTDRITQTVIDVTSNYGTNVVRTRTYVYPALNDGTTRLLTSTEETSTDGLRNWQTTHGLVTKSQTAFAPGGNRYMTNVAPDNSFSVSHYLHGRLQSVTRRDSTGAQLGKSSYAYDSHGRTQSETDARNGAFSYEYDNLDRRIVQTTPSPGGGQSSQSVTNHVDSMGRIWKVGHPDGSFVTNEFYATGLLKRTSGSRTYPVEYAYTAHGRLSTMKTWGDFANNALTSTTTWAYNSYSGLLSGKTPYGTSYTYTKAGRVSHKAGARVGCAFTFDNAGGVASMTYTDAGATPGVSFTYDRLGRTKTIVRNSITTTLTYNDAGLVVSEAYSGGTLNGLTLTNGYDSLLRRTGSGVSAFSATQQAFGYDNASRLQSVTNAGYSVTYGYLANSPMIETATFKSNATTRLSAVRAYDFLNRQTSITSTPSAAPALSFAYQYNQANQRTNVTLVDGSAWRYSYDALGQLVSGKRHWSDGTPVAGQQFEYSFSDIGNRKNSKAGGDASGGNLRTTYYHTSYGQLYARNIPGAFDILGTSDSGATVTVNGMAAYRRGEYFHKELSYNNSLGSGGVYAPALVRAVNGTNSSTVAGTVSLPNYNDAHVVDADGNLSWDSLLKYAWDGENRLIRVETQTVSAAPPRKIEFEYDWQGRRIGKKMYALDGYNWVLVSNTKFLYEGWNLIAELDGSNTLLRHYTWGADLSGALQGAGGIGGLVKVTIHQPQVSHHFPAYDGNGNVAGLINAGDGATSAVYEYGPFGELIRLTGTIAKLNPIRWSTKYVDEESDLVYYGRRYYRPHLGRWISRDPIEERGGLNLYGHTANSPINAIDALGLEVIDKPNWSASRADYEWHYGHHSVMLRLPCKNRERILDRMYAQLLRFDNYFPHVAEIKIMPKGTFNLPGQKAVFNTHWLPDPQFNLIEVQFAGDSDLRMVWAMTLDNHPLVGVRRWGIRKVRGRVFEVFTDAWEKPRNPLNSASMAFFARDLQFQMWSGYMEDFARAWDGREGVYWDPKGVLGRNLPTINGAMPNPFRMELPKELRE